MMRWMATAAVSLVVAPALLGAPRALILHDELGPMQTVAAALQRHGFDVVLRQQADFHPPEAASLGFMYVDGDLQPDVTDAHPRRSVRRPAHCAAPWHRSGEMRGPRGQEFLGVRILPCDAPDNALIVLRGDVDVVKLAPGHWVTAHGRRVARHDRPHTVRRALSRAATSPDFSRRV
jgi:hypothetical protein